VLYHHVYFPTLSNSLKGVPSLPSLKTAGFSGRWESISL
jgi:hypothetical protein